MELGEISIALNAFFPTPARETAAGALAALLVICSEAERLPEFVGTNEIV